MGSDGAAALLEWYDGHARDLPWRRPGVGAWAVLVSEVMLQQTPVARVLPSYRAWLGRWPTPAALAADPVGEAVRQWGRLGYPRRAVRLHAAATAIVERHGGEVPSELDALLALPGVGAYTARAVASFAFGRRQPVIDTNVLRVLDRALPTLPAGAVAQRATLEALLPAEPAVAARFSVALMELGALVCTAREPTCSACPLANGCGWDGTSRRPPRRQRYDGTDRQARGRLLAALRDACAALPRDELLAGWPDPAQARRALTGLVADGLAVDADGLVALPGGADRGPPGDVRSPSRGQDS